MLENGLPRGFVQIVREVPRTGRIRDTLLTPRDHDGCRTGIGSSRLKGRYVGVQSVDYTKEVCVKDLGADRLADCP